MYNKRLAIDTFFRYLIRYVSLFSILALGSMLLFVFIQGIEPFIFSTRPNIQVVVQNINNIKVNGETYTNHRTFIDIDNKAEYIDIHFINRGEEVNIRVKLNRKSKNINEFISVDERFKDNLSIPEAYTFTLSFKGVMPGLNESITILMPEPPYSFFHFIMSSEWRPTYNKIFGIFSMIAATVLSTIGAVVIGVPLALLSSVLIAEFLPKKLAGVIQSGIDLLAGIPSVVYGFFGLMIIVPLVQKVFNSASGSSLIAAVFILAIMVLPTIIAITVTSLQAVPKAYKEASLAVGASKMQTSWRIVFPAARSGILAGIILGVSRAIGETMAVILVAGNSPQIPSALTDSVRTLTATIALEMGYAQGRHNQMLFSVGIVLFAMILVLNAVILKLKKHLAEEQ